MLNKIVARKREDLKRRKQDMPLATLKERIAQRRAPLDFAAALQGDQVRMIAEVKRASPSRGILCPDFEPATLATRYAQGGAAAISVLTEENYFGGSLDHLLAIREAVTRASPMSTALIPHCFSFLISCRVRIPLSLTTICPLGSNGRNRRVVLMSTLKVLKSRLLMPITPAPLERARLTSTSL